MLLLALVGRISFICWLLLISILDCPEHIQTSPIKIFSRTIVFLLPFKVMVLGPSALALLILVFHFTVFSAIIVSVSVFQEEIIIERSLGSAHPQSDVLEFCCKTILLLIIGGSLMIAMIFEVKNKQKIKEPNNKSFFIINGFTV